MTPRPSVGKAWRQAAAQLAAAGIEAAAGDAKRLAGIAFGLDALELSLEENQAVSEAQREGLAALVLRRLAREPVARIAGEQDFYGLTFGLNAATLVPRPETELLVDLGLEAIAERPRPLVLDLGTGTGCVAISLLKQAPRAFGVGVDKSAEALDMARRNAERHDVAARFRALAGHWFSPLSDGESFDLIVGNPPYVAHGDIAALAPEVRQYDPLLALDGGPDGFAAFERIIAGAGERLVPGGALMLEHGAGQGDGVETLMSDGGFAGVTRHRDLAGLDRVAVGWWKP